MKWQTNFQKQGLIVDKYSFYARTQLHGAGYCYLAVREPMVLRTNMDYQGDY